MTLFWETLKAKMTHSYGTATIVGNTLSKKLGPEKQISRYDRFLE
jgi:hypothetical protein